MANAPDEEGMILPNTIEAQREASRSLADLARDTIREDGSPRLAISVRTSDGPVFQATLQWVDPKRRLRRPANVMDLRDGSSENMCTKCIEFDNKIARYMRLASQITEPTSDAILQMIERMKAEKAALHGEHDGQGPGATGF